MVWGLCRKRIIGTYDKKSPLVTQTTNHKPQTTNHKSQKMISIYEHNVIVLRSDIDENRHANNLCYLRWMNEAAVGHS
ncbi:MAG: hypothetical protein LBC02_10430, partial [Planctomycetaceae bacterium]|nr:hypothetical protein [Planctomycetaceae bacterium]